jgi:hypothetical protein
VRLFQRLWQRRLWQHAASVPTCSAAVKPLLPACYSPNPRAVNAYDLDILRVASGG